MAAMLQIYVIILRQSSLLVYMVKFEILLSPPWIVCLHDTLYVLHEINYAAFQCSVFLYSYYYNYDFVCFRPDMGEF